MHTVSHKYLSFSFLFQLYMHSEANFERIDMGLH